jgi:hypothetical protein
LARNTANGKEQKTKREKGHRREVDRARCVDSEMWMVVEGLRPTPPELCVSRGALRLLHW